jgi:hypothetical protein
LKNTVAIIGSISCYGTPSEKIFCPLNFECCHSVDFMIYGIGGDPYFSKKKLLQLAFKKGV